MSAGVHRRTTGTHRMRRTSCRVADGLRDCDESRRTCAGAARPRARARLARTRGARWARGAPAVVRRGRASRPCLRSGGRASGNPLNSVEIDDDIQEARFEEHLLRAGAVLWQVVVCDVDLFGHVTRGRIRGPAADASRVFQRRRRDGGGNACRSRVLSHYEPCETAVGSTLKPAVAGVGSEKRAEDRPRPLHLLCRCLCGSLPSAVLPGSCHHAAR